MSQRIEFGTKTAADAFREEHAEHVCPVDDDKRMKTVALVSNAPEAVVEQAEMEAAASRGERTSDGGQVELTDTERDQIDFSADRANVPWARSIKGVARSEGVDDWTAFVDESLTVDEHREVMQRAARDDQGRRLDVEESADEKLARSEGGQCDHARGHCEHGDPEACEFLREACGYDEEEVEQLLNEDARDHASNTEPEQQTLVTVGGDEYPEMEVTPAEAGALKRSWGGYRAAVGRLDQELSDVREAVRNARQAMAAINAIREQHEQEPIHPNRLHDLLDALGDFPESIPEVRTLAHFADAEAADPDQTREQFADDQQGTLDAGVTAEEVAEDKQVTLGGADAENAVGPVPDSWTREGSNWRADPFHVGLDSADGGRTWDVRLFGPGNTETVASGVRDATRAEAIAREFTDRLDPEDVSFHKSDSAVPTAAAAAKKAAPDATGGLTDYT